MEFEPSKAYCVVKSVSRKPATVDQYRKNKVRQAMILEMTRTNSLVFEHFQPDNILARMGFVWKEDAMAGDGEEADTDNTAKNG